MTWLRTASQRLLATSHRQPATGYSSGFRMHHTLVALVEDEPGVLNRIASLFRRRAFNIEYLPVGRTAEPGISRTTLVVDSDQTSVERVIAYLYKLVNVLQ